MAFLRPGRRSAKHTPSRLIPGTTLLITDLHRDFLPGGALAAPGADAVAKQLIRLLTSLGADSAPYRSADVIVEGTFWDQGSSHPLAPGWPEHGHGHGIAGLPEPVLRSNLERHTWTFCPANGDADLLATYAEGGGQSFTLRSTIAEDHSPAEIHVAGLSVEHAGLALARTLAERLGDRGTQLAFRADLSTFLHPDQAPDLLHELEQAGVRLIRDYPS